MPITVDSDEAVHGLSVVREGLGDVSLRAQRGREVQLRRAKEIMWRADFLATLARFVGQLGRANEVIHRKAVVDQVSRGRERAHVILAKVVAVSLQDVLPLLKRVPVVPGFPQRGRELFRRGEPLGVLPAADCIERVGDIARDVQRFLVLAKASQVASYSIIGQKGLRIVWSQDPAPVLEGAPIGLQCHAKLAELPVIKGDVILNIQRARMRFSKENFGFRQQCGVAV
jgi:hypothetical protein